MSTYDGWSKYEVPEYVYKAEDKNELRLADGTPVRVVGELPIGEWTPVTSNGSRMKWDGFLDSSVSLTGKLTLDDIDDLLDKMWEEEERNPQIIFYISKQRYWELQYLAQGKRYPRPRKRKSLMRMSKKWRDKYVR